MKSFHNRNRNKYSSNVKKGIYIPKMLTSSIYNINDIKKNSINTEYISIDNSIKHNTIKNLKKDISFQTKKILNDFKNIIKQTETLKKRIKGNHKHHLSINYNLVNNKLNENINNINKKEYNNKGYNYDYFLDSNPILNYNKSSNNIIKNSKPLPLRYILIDNEKKNIKLINKNLTESNIDLINQNNELEKKIYKYNKKKNKIQYKQQTLNYYDQNLKKFINNLKLCSQKNINENLQLTKKILDNLKEIQSIYNKYNMNNDIYKNSSKKLIKDINKIEKDQNYNNDYKKLYNLKDEQNKLNKELGKLKNNLNDLKLIEKNLSIKYETELKSKQDFEELVYNLNNTIKNLKNEKKSFNRVSSIKNIDKSNSYSLNNSYSLDIYESKINQLNSIIKSIENQKIILYEENFKLKKEKKELNIDKTNKKEIIKENDLKKQLEDLKNETNTKKNNLQKKDNQIKILKNIIKKLSKSTKDNNMNTKNFNLNIEELTKEDTQDIEFENILNENNLEEDIKKSLILNEMKLKEISNMTKTYENLINEKDKEIRLLESKTYNKSGLIKTIEDKVKPLYKKNIISKDNIFTHIKKNNSNITSGQITIKISKNINNNIILNSQKNIHDIDNKYDYIINKILKKNLKEKNFINKSNNFKKDKYIPFTNSKKIISNKYIKQIYNNHNYFEQFRCLK